MCGSAVGASFILLAGKTVIPHMFRQVLEKGTWCCPAHKAYPHGSKVYCDRCGAPDISACVHFDAQDLCCACAGELASEVHVPATGVVSSNPTQSVVGMTLEEAERAWPMHEFRVIGTVRVDGTSDHYIVTADYISTRVNVKLDHHNVILSAQCY